MVCPSGLCGRPWVSTVACDATTGIRVFYSEEAMQETFQGSVKIDFSYLSPMLSGCFFSY